MADENGEPKKRRRRSAKSDAGDAIARIVSILQPLSEEERVRVNRCVDAYFIMAKLPTGTADGRD